MSQICNLKLFPVAAFSIFVVIVFAVALLLLAPSISLTPTTQSAQWWEQAQLAPSLQENIWFSLRHGSGGNGDESRRVAEGLVGYFPPPNNGGNKGQNRGDGNSSGSVVVRAGIDAKYPNLVNFAVMYKVGSYSHFVVIQAPVQLIQSAAQIPMGWLRLGDSQYYYNPSGARWTCAWILSERPSNGHGTPPESMWLRGQAGSDAYWSVVSKYQLVIPVVEFPIPPLW